MEVLESSLNLLGKIANIFTSLLTIVVTTLIIRFIFYLNYSFCRKREKWEKEKSEIADNKSKKEYPWQCLLIDGAWGSGKTTHYEKYYQYIDNKPNIYISCFSASRSELIAQIIQQQFWCKLLTLNGLLAKFMESNWQIFMPKNRVVVFDDLERLHANKDNYLDLIGVIDYLKTANKCQVILIADISKTPQIFNSYLERVVDEVLTIPKLQLIDLFSLEYNHEKDHRICIYIQSKQIVIDEILKQCQVLHNCDQLNNLRIFKNVFIKLATKIQTMQKIEEWDDKLQLIYAKFFAKEFKNIILKGYIYFIDNELFKRLCSSAVSAEAEGYYILNDTSISKQLNERLNEKQKPLEPEISKARKLNDKLDNYTNELQASDFNHKDKELFNKKLDIDMTNVKLIEFVLYQPEQFIKINSNDNEQFQQRLFNISKDRQLNLAEWKNYLRDHFIPQIIEKLKAYKQHTWIPEYYSGCYGEYNQSDFSCYYQMAIILTQIGVDSLIIDEIIERMVQCERHNRNFGDSAKNWVFDDSMNRSIKMTLWEYKFYRLIWFLDCDVKYETNTIKEQINQKIDTILFEIQSKIKQKLNDGRD